jgi:Glycogen recognition site of AMP-activated protein kinase
MSNVEVVGNFTNPPWSKRVELDFCPLRGIFVKYINNLTEGTYLIKFIVNGEYRCDDHLLPTVTDSSGHINNVLEIGYDNETERFSIVSS